MSASAKTQSAAVRVSAYRGDAKTLLAFDLAESRATKLAGFTIHCQPPGGPAYYLYNTLRFPNPAVHTQVAGESTNSSVNAPFQKFRWLHVPGSVHQGVSPAYGTYTYAVTPRYLDGRGSMQPLDPSITASLQVEVQPLDDNPIQLGFTRGYVQSQAFANHFGVKALIRPHDQELLFDTSLQAGTNGAGQQYSYADEYGWLGSTARGKIFAVLEEVRSNQALRLDVFAYDLDEPDVLKILLELAEQGRVRIILDNSSLHHNPTKPKPEDQFEILFENAAQAPAEMKRGKFGRYAHDKILIVSDSTGAQKVLTGSTNFSVTGLYVNANHVLLFPNGNVASKYAELFDTVWQEGIRRPPFLSAVLSSETFSIPGSPPGSTITFAPHTAEFATTILERIVSRVQQEGNETNPVGTVLFAVMDISGKNPVYDALNALHAERSIFSMGISDSPDGISLYSPGSKTGVLVTGKPNKLRLPPPFNQVPGIGLEHQIHHKFVVCGFSGEDPVVYCGSSNLAQGGEEQNGDNLLEIHDPAVVMAFTIEALALVDHFQFLDRLASNDPAEAKAKIKSPPAVKQEAAASAGWFLSSTDKWTKPYFDPNDLHYVDRQLFA